MMHLPVVAVALAQIMAMLPVVWTTWTFLLEGEQCALCLLPVATVVRPSTLLWTLGATSSLKVASALPWT